jgi:hypothetical protein
MSKLGKMVRLDEDHWKHVQEHLEMVDELDKLKQTLSEPDEIRTSVYDSSVWLFYRLYNHTPVTEKYSLVIVRVLNEEGFILTAFFTDTVKKGNRIWNRKR